MNNSCQGAGINVYRGVNWVKVATAVYTYSVCSECVFCVCIYSVCSECVYIPSVCILCVYIFTAAQHLLHHLQPEAVFSPSGDHWVALSPFSGLNRGLGQGHTALIIMPLEKEKDAIISEF